MIQFWVLRRYFGSKKIIFNATSLFAVFGMALGVGSLIVAMSVVSGYERTLHSALTDFAGHLMVTKRGGQIDENENVLKRVKELTPGFQAWTPFTQLEGMIAHEGKIAGVLLEGLSSETHADVLSLESRVTDGTFDITAQGAVVGIGVAKNFNLKVGDEFAFIRPLPSESSNRLLKKMEIFTVSGLIDLGKIQYNERLVLINSELAQKLKPSPGAFSGIKIRIDKAENAPGAGQELRERIGYPYYVRDWKDLNSNLLEAIRIEKPVIFFVILIMVIAACFNVCSHLLVDVLKKYSDISILRTMGASRRSLMWLFSFHGMLIGVVGSSIGVGLGWLLSQLFVIAQKSWGFSAGKTYKLAQIGVDLTLTDFLFVMSASLLICFLATLPPAIRGAKLSPVEGLKYE